MFFYMLIKSSDLSWAGDRRDMVSIPGLGKSPGEGNGNPLQCSCLENPMDPGAWQATVHGVTKSQTQLNTQTQQLGYVITTWVIMQRNHLPCM